MKIRILPLLIIFLSLIIVIKFVDLVTGSRFSHHNFFAMPAFAEEEGGEGEGHDEAKKENKTTSKSRSNLKFRKPATTDPSIYGSGPEKPECAFDLVKEDQFTPAEVEMLKKLSERRKDLDKQKDMLIDKENLLRLTESKIDSKIKEMNKLKNEIAQLVNAYHQNEDQKIENLVKIYTNMKPKDAARIFEQLDLTILLQVISKMKEAKAAPILAQMNPTKAKDLTIEIAGQKKIKLGCTCPVDGTANLLELKQ